MNTTTRRAALGPAALLLAVARPGSAQTDYYNTDAGRPIRVEDATVIERHAIDLQPFPLALQRTSANFYRFKAEPHVGYGVLPMTQVEFGAPVVIVDRGARRQAALAGLEVSAMHAFNLETQRLPAFALDVDVVAPVGGFAPERPQAAFKGIATRTFSGLGRLHVNAEYSFSPSRRCAAENDPQPICQVSSGVLPPFVPPVIDDPGLPCLGVTRPAADGVRAACVSAASSADVVAAAASTAAQQQTLPRRVPGFRRWMVGIGADHTLPLRSVLFAADLFADWSPAGGTPVNWTAEGGVRYQLSPRTVLDAGAGSNFRGRGRSWFLTFGASYAFALRSLVGGAR